MNLFNKAMAVVTLAVLATMAMVGTHILGIEIDDPYDPYE